MTTRDPRKLLERLDDHLARGLEAAAGFCVARGHYEVTQEHLLLKLIEDGSGDIPRILADGRGWVVPPQDPRAIANALDEIFDDPEKAARAGERARGWVIENASYDSVRSTLMGVIAAAIDRRR